MLWSSVLTDTGSVLPLDSQSRDDMGELIQLNYHVMCTCLSRRPWVRSLVATLGFISLPADLLM